MNGHSRSLPVVASCMMLFLLASIGVGKDLLLSDDFAVPKYGPINSEKWEVVHGKPPVCDGGRLINMPNQIWNSRKKFAEPVSVEFSGVFVAQLPRSPNNQLGLAPGGHGPDMVVWALDGSVEPKRLVPLRHVGGKDFWRDGYKHAVELSKLPDINKRENAVNLRIDWWPGKRVRYFLNDKLQAEFTTHVPDVAVPVGVRDESVYFRIDAIKVTRIPQSSDQTRRKETKQEAGPPAERSRGPGVLLFDGFDGDGPLDTKATWEMASGTPRGFSGDGLVLSTPKHNWHSRRKFAEPISVTFAKVSVVQLPPRGWRNLLGLASDQFRGEALGWLFDGTVRPKQPMLPYMRSGGKDYWHYPDAVSVDPADSLGDITKRDHAVDLRIDWWPGKLVRYYANDKPVVGYTKNVPAGPCAVAVLDFNVHFRIDSIIESRTIG